MIICSLVVFFLLGITELEVQEFTDFTEFNNVMPDWNHYLPVISIYCWHD